MQRAAYRRRWVAGQLASGAIADTVVDTIRKVAKTDKIGDGKIFVLDLSQVMRVRTGETGEDAL